MAINKSVMVRAGLFDLLCNGGVARQQLIVWSYEKEVRFG